ncbi:hypothetical protein BT96DRAFT_1000397 [Gymnopus androsaceus JB14]|uniref:Uncharacterized protein n=1 Tax=Gymnopus androsaceus JB14 TaxID=1447944 RepID=A0A6A4H3M3_9AGAR|nr:hypothetical protein BT96DRAFT_1000397 [Gymnopus androsaceus JB14]
MDLSLLESDAYNTLLVQSNGVPLYHIKTALNSHRHSHTLITKVIAPEEGEGEIEDKEMAHIEIHRWHSSIVTVWGRSFLPSKTHLLSSSEAFIASNVEFEALSILDEVVTTFVYMQQKRHRREPSEISEEEKLLMDIDPTTSSSYYSISPLSSPRSPQRSPRI